MPVIDQIKNYGRKLAEDRPTAPVVKKLIRKVRPKSLRFSEDGVVPNNPRFPVLLYRNVLKKSAYAPAVLIDALFESNGWARSWRDTVYDFLHYHSQIHEALGIARGIAKIECGGIKGRVLKVKAGDVLVLPAGTGHRLINATRNFLVVGAYPASGTYDECTDIREFSEAKKRIAKTVKPKQDPLFGKNGPLTKLWRR